MRSREKREMGRCANLNIPKAQTQMQTILLISLYLTSIVYLYVYVIRVHFVISSLRY